MIGRWCRRIVLALMVVLALTIGLAVGVSQSSIYKRYRIKNRLLGRWGFEGGTEVAFEFRERGDRMWVLRPAGRGMLKSVGTTQWQDAFDGQWEIRDGARATLRFWFVRDKVMEVAWSEGGGHWGNRFHLQRR